MTPEIKNIVDNLKNKKAPGPDKIRNECFKHEKIQIVSHITSLFNKILKENRVTTSWKLPDIILIYKKRDKQKMMGKIGSLNTNTNKTMICTLRHLNNPRVALAVPRCHTPTPPPMVRISFLILKI